MYENREITGVKLVCEDKMNVANIKIFYLSLHKFSYHSYKILLKSCYMMTLENRRTVRQYSPKEIEQTLLDSLLSRACRASNTGNMQWYSIITTTDTNIKKALAPAHFNQPQCTSAPLLLTFCADLNRFSQWCSQRNAQPGYGNFQSFMAAAIDATIVAQAFATEAEAAGLGICYLGTTTYNAAEIIEVLKLPKLTIPITTLSVGYPAEPLPALSERLPLEAVVHKEVYQNYTPQEIDQLFAEKEEINRHFAEENGKETLAQVFTDIRYTREASELFSEKFIAVLKTQGLL